MPKYVYRGAIYTKDGNIDCEIDHPEFGWIPTTISLDDDADFFNEVRAGVVADYVAPPPPPPPTDEERYLSRVQFEHMLALSGFDDVWEALEAAAKPADRAQFATLKAERARSRFQLARTLLVVATFRDTAAQLVPGFDLSDATIRAAWDQAENYST